MFSGLSRKLNSKSSVGVESRPETSQPVKAWAIVIFTLSRWEWGAVAVALFIVGTEIRVHSEEKLLAGRFGAEFHRYRGVVPAYIPFVR